MFEVINPIIVGKFKIKYDSDNALDAAKKFWNDMTGIIVSEIPKSFFTLRDEKGKLYHFKVTEEKSGQNIVDYMLTQIKGVAKDDEGRLMEIFDKVEQSAQTGGRKHRYETSDDDDSSISSSLSDDSDVFENFRKMKTLHPIVYYHYVPNIYDTNDKRDSLFIPVFMYPYQPSYMEVGFSTAFWG